MKRGERSFNMKINIFKNKITSIIAALIVCALWGSLFPCVKLGYSAFHIHGNDIPAIILFAGIRFSVSGIVLVLFSCIKDKRLNLPEKRSLASIFHVALASIILHYSFTYVALSIGEGSKSAIIKQVGFLFLSCFAFLFDKEDKFSLTKLVSGVLGFAGIIVTNLDSTGFTFGIGDFLLILASLCSCLSMIISKKATKTINPVRLVAYSQLMGGIFLCVAGTVSGGRITYTDRNAVLIFGYICFASITAYSMWNILIKYNKLSKLSIIKFTEPLFAVVFSGILLGESIFKITYLAAFVIILAAILISNLKLRDGNTYEKSKNI